MRGASNARLRDGNIPQTHDDFVKRMAQEIISFEFVRQSRKRNVFTRRALRFQTRERATTHASLCRSAAGPVSCLGSPGVLPSEVS